MNLTCVWEFGGGMGHLAAVVPVARAAARRGHDAALVLKNLRHLLPFLGDDPIPFYQAPTEQPLGLQKFPVTATYGQLLHNLGFGERQHLGLKAGAWRNLFALLRPDLVVCNHAPIAMLALRSLGIPYVTLGTGFTVPVSATRDGQGLTTSATRVQGVQGLTTLATGGTRELPILRAEHAPAAEVRAEQDARLLENANSFLACLRAPLLTNIAELYTDAAESILATYPELDHFPERSPGVRYWGSWPQGIGDAPKFPAGSGPRVFAYLKPCAALEALFTELNRLGLPTLICGSGLSAELKARHQSATLAFSPGPVELDAALAECDFAILNATHGTLSAALVAGKPVLNIPLQLEQAMLAKSYARLGAGVIAAQRDGAATVKALHFLIQHHAQMQESARKSALKYGGQEKPQTIKELVDTLESITRH